MDGVVVTKSEDGVAWICHVESFSDELKTQIRKNLASICYGESALDSDSRLYSYKATLKEFLSRYGQKRDRQKKGLIGELLAQVIILHEMPHMVPASPYFNMEEKSMRKGFDLVLLDDEEDVVWVTEFKSGARRVNQGSDAKNNDLINGAKNDLYERLNENNQTFWLNALNSAKVSVRNADSKKTIVSILEGIGDDVVDELAVSTDRDVILSTIMYGSLQDKVTFDYVANKQEVIAAENLFNNVVIFSIQKGTYTRVADFLAEEAE